MTNIKLGKLYYSEFEEAYYIVIKYMPNGVPGTSIKNCKIYEVINVASPDEIAYAAKQTVEDWRLVE